jgi:hypothetical protein
MNLSWKSGTRDKRHLPPNVEEIKRNFFLRFLFLVATYHLHPLLCINMDETGQILFPTKNKTWAGVADDTVEIVVSYNDGFTWMPRSGK